jgi:hypothetical protein
MVPTKVQIFKMQKNSRLSFFFEMVCQLYELENLSLARKRSYIHLAGFSDKLPESINLPLMAQKKQKKYV